MTDNLYLVLFFAFLSFLSIAISVVISKSAIEKSEANFKTSLDNINKSMSDSCAFCKVEIDNIKNDVIALRDEVKKLPDTLTVNTDDKLNEMKETLSSMENKLNILDSTVKNIERMKDVEINCEDSEFFYTDEPQRSKMETIKEKIVSTCEKAVEMGKKIDVNTVVKNAPAVINAVKKVVKK